MTSIYLERREPAHHRQRFYAITVTRTLFGSWAMVREMEFATEAEAWAAGEQLRQRKEKRGYHAVGG